MIVNVFINLYVLCSFGGGNVFDSGTVEICFSNETMLHQGLERTSKQSDNSHFTDLRYKFKLV